MNQLLDQISTISKNTAIATGAATAAGKATQEAGLIDWVGENAFAIGALCSIGTFVVYFGTSVIRTYLDIKRR